MGACIVSRAKAITSIPLSFHPFGDRKQEREKKNLFPQPPSAVSPQLCSGKTLKHISFMLDLRGCLSPSGTFRMGDRKKIDEHSCMDLYSEHFLMQSDIPKFS